MDPQPSEKKIAVSATTVIIVIILIGATIYGYIVRENRIGERAKQKLTPPTEDQAEKIAKERK